MRSVTAHDPRATNVAYSHSYYKIFPFMTSGDVCGSISKSPCECYALAAKNRSCQELVFLWQRDSRSVRHAVVERPSHQMHFQLQLQVTDCDQRYPSWVVKGNNKHAIINVTNRRTEEENGKGRKPHIYKLRGI